MLSIGNSNPGMSKIVKINLYLFVGSSDSISMSSSQNKLS